MKKALLILSLIASVIGGFFAVKAYQADREKTQALNALRSRITAVLKDPSAAQFRNEVFIQEKRTLCGEVNAKNSFGAYVGFKEFIVADPGYTIYGDSFQNWNWAQTSPQPPQGYTEAVPLIERGSEPGAEEYRRSTADSLRKDLFIWLWQTQCNSQTVPRKH